MTLPPFATVLATPAGAMLLGSASVFCLQVPDWMQACFQMFSAGLLISAVAGELFPLLNKSNDLASNIGLVSGFLVGILFMFSIGKIMDAVEGGDDEDIETRSRAGSTLSTLESGLAAPLLECDATALQAFQTEAQSLQKEVLRLNKALDAGVRDEIDEALHVLEFCVHKAHRRLSGIKNLDCCELSRMKVHYEELLRDAEQMAKPSSCENARVALSAFEGTLKHLHEHAERRRFRRWEAKAPPPKDSAVIYSEKLPLALIAGVTIDASVDGLLIGLSFTASPTAGWAMSLATCIEMGFLGLSFCASVQQETRSLFKRCIIAVLPPLMIMVAGAVGYYAGNVLEENQAVFIGFIAFSIVALLFLVTQELLTEAKEIAEDSVSINAMFFVGLLCGILLEKVLDASPAQ